MNDLELADAAFECAATASVYLVDAEPSSIAAVARAHSAVTRFLKAGEDELEPLASILRRARARLTTNILPPAHPALALDTVIEELADIQVSLDPTTAIGVLARDALESLKALLSIEISPLAREVEELLEMESPERRVVVLSRGRNVIATEQYLVDRGLSSMVVPSSQLRRLGTPLGTMICVGPPEFFPSATWSAAKADSVCFVQYPLGRRQNLQGGLFGDSGGLTTPVFRNSKAIAPLPAVDFMDPDESIVELGQREASKYRSTSHDAALACLLILEGGWGVWTAAETNSWMWGLQIEEDRVSVVQTASQAVVAGSFVVLRVAGAANGAVRELADRNFGTIRLRSTQSRWKSQVSRAIDAAGGFTAATHELERRGVSINGLRSWISEHYIRPNSRSKFDAVTQWAGLETEASQIWSDLTEIRRAHQKAGLIIRKQLEAALIEQGPAGLLAAGYLDLKVEDFGELSSHRVLHKHPDLEYVPPSMVDVRFRVEDDNWLE